MKKMIIRIGGTAYSGSTFLSLMLANDHHGFSCGEVRSLFHPSRLQHFGRECTCQDPACKIWEEVKAGGELQMWQTLTGLLPETHFFVDSSKSLAWFFDQAQNDGHHDLKVRNILIWKTPAEFAYSRMKRNKLKNWKKAYINYYIRYFRIVKQWHSVCYSDLAKNPTKKIKKLCSLLDIIYFKNKEFYWNRQHHTIGGSNVAKLHLYDPNNKSFNRIRNELNVTKPNVNSGGDMEVTQHRSLHYDFEVFNKLPLHIQEEIKGDSRLQTVQKVLMLTEIDSVADKVEVEALINSLRIFPSWHIWYFAQKIKSYVGFLKCTIIILKYNFSQSLRNRRN